MRIHTAWIACVAALLLAGSSARAQQAFDITNCSSTNADKIRTAVRDAIAKYSRINAAPANTLQSAINDSHGLAYQDPNSGWFWQAVWINTYHNIHAVLTGGAPGNVLGPPPVLRRVVFHCSTSPSGDAVGRNDNVNNRIILYPVFFQIPHTGHFSSVAASRVGTVLHEAMHWVTGTSDVFVNGGSQKTSAETLIRNNDTRAFTNATNYEMFFMRPW